MIEKVVSSLFCKEIDELSSIESDNDKNVLIDDDLYSSDFDIQDFGKKSNHQHIQQQTWTVNNGCGML